MSEITAKQGLDTAADTCMQGVGWYRTTEWHTSSVVAHQESQDVNWQGWSVSRARAVEHTGLTKATPWISLRSRVGLSKTLSHQPAPTS